MRLKLGWLRTILRGTLVLALLLALTPGWALAAEADRSRFCWGMVYCEETKGGTTTTTAFLWLYSTEERGTFSRFTIRPLYARELDPVREYFRQSVLWPLWIAEREGASSYSQFLPVYWHADRPGTQYTIVVPFYSDYAKKDRRYTYVLPLYGHHQRGDYYDQYFILGPLAMATFDTQKDLREWDILFPLFHRGEDQNGFHTRLVPLYVAGEDRSEGTAYRHVIPLYGFSEDPQRRWEYVSLLYGHVNDRTKEETRTSVLGLPPFPTVNLPALSLYERISSPDMTSSRVFPLYRAAHTVSEDLTEVSALLLYQSRSSPSLNVKRLLPVFFYEEDLARERVAWSLVGYGDWSLARYLQDPQEAAHHVVPLYRVTEDIPGHTRTVDAIGLGSLSLFEHYRGPDEVAHRVFPLYTYDEAGAEAWRLSIVGAGPVAFYRHTTREDVVRDRSFLLHDYRRNGEWSELSVIGTSSLSWFRYDRGPTLMAHRLFPLWGYRSTPQEGWRLALLGGPPREGTFAWSLYEQAGSPTYFLSRFFPLYRLENNETTKEWSLAALLLFHYLDSEARLEHRLWPLHEYERDKVRQESELHLLGVKPLTLFRGMSGPDAAASHFVPLYEYDRDGDARRLALLGVPRMGESAVTWSLFEGIRTPSLSAHRLFPLYRYRRDDQARTREWEALLLWWHRENEQRMRNVFVPLVDVLHDKTEEVREVGVLGIRPLTLFKHRLTPTGREHSFVLLYGYERDGDRGRVSAIGLPHLGTLPALSLFAREWTATSSSSRFFPVYRSHHDEVAKVRDWDALLLWWHRETAQRSRNTVVPLFDREVEVDTQASRGSALGLPRLGTLPALSLVAWEAGPSLTAHRFFPVYRYHHDKATQVRDWDALLLWWHRETAQRSRNVIVPLFDREVETATQATRGSVLGLPRMGALPALSLFTWEAGPSLTMHRLFPVWAYERDEDAKRMSMNILLLYWRLRSPEQSSTVALPLFTDFEDHQKQERAIGILGLGPLSMYYQVTSPVSRTARFFPLVGYRHDREKDERHLGVLGVAPLSLYYGFASPTASERRLFPLFRYTADHVKDEAALSVLWPLVDYRRVGGRVAEASVLWWLYHYRSPEAGDREFWVMGYPPVAFIVRTETPETTRVEINPILPLWWRESVAGQGTSWALFGGLVGVDALPDGGRKVRLFWLFHV